MVDKIGKVTLYVTDQEKAKDFWVEKMGFSLRFEQQMGPNMKWIEVSPKKDSETTFVLYSKELMQTQNPNANVEHPSVLLSTRDIEKAQKKMRENGVKTEEISRMPYGNMFQFYDADGNMFLLREN